VQSKHVIEFDMPGPKAAPAMLPPANNRGVKRQAQSNAKMKMKAAKSGKYSIPAGSTVDSNGNLVLPRTPSTSRMSSASSESSIAGSLHNLNTASAAKPQKQQQKPPITSNSSKKVKPIIVDANYKVTDQLLNNLKLTSKPLMRIISASEHKAQTRIECATIDDKVVVISALRDKKFIFHSYQEPGKRTKLFVLKDHYRIELNEMEKVIKEAGIPASKVTFLSDHPDRPVYLLHSTDENLTINTLQYRHRALGSLIIKWDRFDFKLKRPMPCRRCKLWGHAANSCGRAFRCIKCTSNHPPGECDRKDRTVGSPKCVNCDGDHPANSTQCPSYLRYAEGIQKHRRIQQKPVSRSNTVRWPSANAAASNSQNFHSNPENNASSYSNIVSGTQNAGFSNDSISQPSQSRKSNFSDLHAQFASIPNIGRTMDLFAEMIAKLKNTEVHSERLLIMMQYCCPQNAS
jgi:hypothetical protein